MAEPAADAAACRKMFADFGRHAAATAPLYAELSAGIAADGDLAATLLQAPPVQRQPVLLFACVHWLLLGDQSAPLAGYYANLNGGGRAAGDPVMAFRAFCATHRDELARLLGTRSTQTNEIGRTSLFLPVFAALQRELGAIAHVDIGASAGLNLLMPHYDYTYEPGGTIARGSRVALTCGTRGDPPLPARHPIVAAALGLDATPLEVTDPEQARWLEACVWPDQVDRFERLAAAIAIAVDVGVDVRRGDAVDDVASAVETVAHAGHPVITTSWVLNYLTSGRRRDFVAALDDIGARRDVSWIYAENPALCPELPAAPLKEPGTSEPTALVLVRWRGGERVAEHLADAHPHGRWLHWLTRAPA